MDDQVSIAFIAEIAKMAEVKLGRSLTDAEKQRISSPRSYLGLEMILDHVSDPDSSAEDIALYLREL
ncbi:MAG: hypothetical protein KKA73_24240 [Chloroflexi bacterium]|nr:hypothetical protein [Chloroflexota bacterium]MBU1750803.1 hypothetical protein [Chloroflexota bacterium]